MIPLSQPVASSAGVTGYTVLASRGKPVYGTRSGHDQLWHTQGKAIRSVWLIPGKVRGEPLLAQ